MPGDYDIEIKDFVVARCGGKVKTLPMSVISYDTQCIINDIAHEEFDHTGVTPDDYVFTTQITIPDEF